MASTSEIRRRIGSVRQTQKITHAMYLISQAKLRKAKADLSNTRPYFDALQAEIGRVFNADDTAESRYLCDENSKPLPGVAACLLITADKGLAGAYNQNAIRQAQQFLSDHEGAELYVVGEYGRRWFTQRGIPIEKSFLYTAQNPTLRRARQIGELLLERYDAGAINAVHIIYTDMKNGLEATVRQAQVLPLTREHFSAVCAQPRCGAGQRGAQLPDRLYLQRAGGQLLQRAVRPYDRHERGGPERGGPAEGPVRAVQSGASGRHHPGDHRGLRR